ncbi:glycoside hydrolase [Coprinopsis marcescibilis]|uniref:Glycoside hydrolase n=1 Tax=Coprinopsis marcescibilis TaxID=230819 RepID=A0A5C3KSN4_COPMA|nr:glycoside hydrolase [Coprinopsis marcescibilis]
MGFLNVEAAPWLLYDTIIAFSKLRPTRLVCQRIHGVAMRIELLLSAWLIVGGLAEQTQRCRLRLIRQGKQGQPTSERGNITATATATATATIESPSTGTTPSSVPTPNSAPFPPFEYGRDVIRAVNLGGWLVLEPWITPSFFERTNNTDVIDEWTLGSLVDREAARRMLIQHWETWITEDDFIAIRAAGLNHVRIPVGYWSVPLADEDRSTTVSSEPYIPGAWQYLLRGLNWARKHGLRVIVDLHGAPGSQNGFDNSGQRTSSPQWALEPDSVAHTVDVLRFIAANVGGMIDILQMLNEPAGFRGDNWAAVVRQFWLDGHDAVREAAGPNMHVMISDAFLGVNTWTSFLTPPRADGVLMDFHEYQIFSHPELDRSLQEHIDFACNYVQTLSAYSSSNLWTVVGEWSNAITDCARWLNGRGIGARWDGTYDSDQFHGSCEGYTGSYENFSEEYRAYLRRYWEAQVEIGEHVQGWIFWTWKAENADEWSYQRGITGGWIPQDPTDRIYPDICTR